MEPEESPGWQQRVDAVWASAQALSDEDVLSAISDLVAERPPEDPAAAFELASAYDFIGREVDAEPAYRRALDLGLEGVVRTRAVIQLASSLRNLERLDESRLLLAAELDANPDSYLRDSVVAFLGLTLIDLGQQREAAIMAIAALAPHLRGYRRAIDHYISELSTPVLSEPESDVVTEPELESDVLPEPKPESEVEIEVDVENDEAADSSEKEPAAS